MTNLFDQSNYPTTEPATLVVGDRWVWKRTDIGADYPPASYTLKYALRLQGSGGTEIEITAVSSGADYLIEVPSVTTAGKISGTYSWQAYLTRNSDSERITLTYGQVTVAPNRDASTAEPRSHARKVLAAIEAVIEGRATRDQEAYSIAGRSLQRTPIEQLLVLRSKYIAEVQKEDMATAVSKGLDSGRRMGVRFVSV